MRCCEIQELFGVYWDLPNTDLRRFQIDDHVKHCVTCREEFEFWQESTELIRNSKSSTSPVYVPAPISHLVMNRIYEAESWRIPVPNRMYSISYKFRRNLTAVIALCLAMFMFSFLYTLVFGNIATNSQGFETVVFGLQEVGTVGGGAPLAAYASASGMIDPYKLNMAPVNPNYLLALSLLGLTGTLLIMNWFSRTRA